MTVRELIAKLQQVENQDLPVCIEDAEYGDEEVTRVSIPDPVAKELLLPGDTNPWVVRPMVLLEWGTQE